MRRAVALVHTGSYAEALRDADKALFLKPGCADIVILRAKIYFELGLKQQGADQMQAARVLRPDHPEVWARVLR